jgi:REP element-mobilizing transposase RayT
MPRKARVLVPNCPHHVVQRGPNKSTVFATADVYAYYKAEKITASPFYSILQLYSK